jgi:hypothetical protein
MRTIKSIVGVGLVVAAALFMGVSAVLASTSSTTTLTANVPSTLSLSGLATSYSVSAPAGVMTSLCTGPLTVTTNGANGYTLSLTWTSANFTAPGGLTFPVSADRATRADTSCNNPGALQTGVANTPVAIFDTTAPGVDSFDIVHQITVPAAQAGGAYAINVTYTVTDR